MKKSTKTLCVVALGVLILILGFIYDVNFAGIPYQDPTPAMQADFDYHKGVATIFYWSGFLVLLIAVFVGLIHWIRTRRK